eukprot:scaffold889_cov379-Prasinococcus_capsulatus_cf.AAC.12
MHAGRTIPPSRAPSAGGPAQPSPAQLLLPCPAQASGRVRLGVIPRRPGRGLGPLRRRQSGGSSRGGPRGLLMHAADRAAGPSTTASTGGGASVQSGGAAAGEKAEGGRAQAPPGEACRLGAGAPPPPQQQQEPQEPPHLTPGSNRVVVCARRAVGHQQQQRVLARPAQWGRSLARTPGGRGHALERPLCGTPQAVGANARGDALPLARHRYLMERLAAL